MFMKKTMFIAFILGSAVLANAQSKPTFRPFKVDFALGYAVPSGSGSKGGVLFAVEPKYAVRDNISVGLRIEAAVTARASIDQSGQEVSGSAKASASYLLTGDYYLSNNQFRPFVGIGAGIYSLASVDISSTGNGEVAAGTKFGVA